MKLHHVLIPVIWLSAGLTDAAPAKDEAQIGMSTNNLGIMGKSKPLPSNQQNLVDRNQKADTAAEKCKSYTDCTRCKPGFWRCCFVGCAGMPTKDTDTCLCFKDGTDLRWCGCN